VVLDVCLEMGDDYDHPTPCRFPDVLTALALPNNPSYPLHTGVWGRMRGFLHLCIRIRISGVHKHTGTQIRTLSAKRLDRSRPGNTHEGQLSL
jgi:hypothetical protein